MRDVIGFVAAVVAEIVLLGVTVVCLSALQFARQRPSRWVIAAFWVLGLTPLVVLPVLVTMFMLGVPAEVRVPIGQWTARLWGVSFVAYVVSMIYYNRGTGQGRDSGGSRRSVDARSAGMPSGNEPDDHHALS